MKTQNKRTEDSPYSFSRQMRRHNGDARFAYATFIIRNDGYLPGALLFAYALRRQKTKADIVCLISDGISNQAIKALENVYDRVIYVKEIYVDNVNKAERNDLPYLFTRFHALRLGGDGDLGCRYDKVVIADADVLPVRYYDHLFTLDTPAGVLNEKPENFFIYDDNGQYIIPDTVYEKGEWRWHEVYNPICPHGKIIPAYITDRVKKDPLNLGINASLYVLKPSITTFHEIIEDLQREDTRKAINRFRWPEMQYLTMAWSGLWHNVDIKFCGFKGYPDYTVLHGIHYAGHKPWLINDYKTLHRMLKFSDNIVWYIYFIDMIRDYPDLLNIKRLKRLYTLTNIPEILQMADYFTLTD